MRSNLVLALAGAWLALGQTPAAQPPTTKPQFEVASVHLCKNDDTGRGGGGTKGGRGGSPTDSSPDRLYLPCLPVRLFIQMAYIDFANGKFRAEPNLRVEGGPDWITSQTERYTINAKADSAVSQITIHGAMLQALLEDRFQLKIHRETREIPVYALTVAKGGPKLKKWEEGSCTTRDITLFPAQRLQDGQPQFCRNGTMIGQKKMTLEAHGVTMAEFAQRLNGSGRPVIDKTGITGRYDIHLEFAPAEGFVNVPPGVEQPDFSGAQSIFTALEELGLKLEPVKGPRDFLVIDHIERPTEN